MVVNLILKFLIWSNREFEGFECMIFKAVKIQLKSISIEEMCTQKLNMQHKEKIPPQNEAVLKMEN